MSKYIYMQFSAAYFECFFSDTCQILTTCNGKFRKPGMAEHEYLAEQKKLSIRYISTCRAIVQQNSNDTALRKRMRPTDSQARLWREQCHAGLWHVTTKTKELIRISPVNKYSCCMTEQIIRLNSAQSKKRVKIEVNDKAAHEIENSPT